MTNHSDFIIAAYGFAALVTLAMILSILRDYRRYRAALSKFEKIPDEKTPDND